MTVCSYASGLPIAHTHSPTRSDSESPSGATGRFLRVDLDQRDVGVGIDAEHARLQAAAVGKLHHDPLGVLDHVVVRQDLAVALDDEAAARLRADRARSLRSGIDVIERDRLRGAPPPASTARVVASMLTTAGLMLSATSAKFTSPAGDGGRTTDSRSCRLGGGLRSARRLAAAAQVPSAAAAWPSTPAHAGCPT